MALGYLINPALQVEDANGKPLVSGFIRVYRHGTTTPIATYKDFTGDLNPVDIPLNLKGMAIILVDPNYLYDVYCYNSHGVEEWSRLNVGVYGGAGGDGRYYVVESTDNSVGVTTSTDPVTSETTIDLSVSDSLSNYKLLQQPVDQSYADYGFVKSLKQTANGNVTLECSYISAATESVTGLMSSSDKTKLDGIAGGAEVNQNAFSNLKVGSSTIAASSKTDTFELAAGSHVTLTPDVSNKKVTIATEWPDLSGYKTKQGVIDNSYADYAFLKSVKQTANGEVSIEASYISAATESVTGLMSSSDKTKLDGISAGAEVNQNAFSNLKVGSTTIYADQKSDTLEIAAGANVTITPDSTNDKITISATDTTYTAGPNIDILGGIVSTEKTKVAAGANISVTSSLDSQTRTVTYTVSGNSSPQVNADWDASSGVSQILNKPSLQFKPYGGTAGKLTGLLIDADDPEGYVGVGVNGGGMGSLVAGPYAGLLNSGVNGVGDSATPIYINSSGQFATCSIPNAEFIQFNYSNTTTAQDDVYAAIAAAYTNGKLPVLTCTVAGGALYWFPTATGQTGYAFARNTSTTCFTAEFDHTLHILTLAQKSIVEYTAGTNVSIDANNQISATDTTYTAGSYININSSNVISNTMHLDTAGLMVSYNTLSNAGTTTHSWGPWRIQITKKAMAVWDTTTASIEIRFAHSDYLDGSITNGAALIEPLYMWKDGNWDDVYTGHTRWSFNGAYDSGPSDGYTIFLDGPTDGDGNNRSMPKKLRGYHFNISCGINSPDWLECKVYPMYINNNTSLQSNGARLLIQAKYFYV